MRAHIKSQKTLDSWKGIANYVGCGVRTAQRWEAEAQLPVFHRAGESPGAVIAFPDQLDHWLIRQKQGTPATAGKRRTPFPARSETYTATKDWDEDHLTRKQRALLHFVKQVLGKARIVKSARG